MAQDIVNKRVADRDADWAEAAIFLKSFHGVPFCSMAEGDLGTFQSALWDALGRCGERGSAIEMTQEAGRKAVADCDAARAEAEIFFVS